MLSSIFCGVLAVRTLIVITAGRSPPPVPTHRRCNTKLLYRNSEPRGGLQLQVLGAEPRELRRQQHAFGRENEIM
ncbi:hypothetical protein BDU57DRAFT_517988 [Ampelomyces quisqualis]|uniref:Secreted protein n=1 Tax=Ampelomyces quisqualis TaxID=50730 RepID=A0A6A5QJY7_AMPQU|nr:hypothetical protein BDU57DRAFT_517988 [Ampelomyces quisqualis]